MAIVLYTRLARVPTAHRDTHTAHAALGFPTQANHPLRAQQNQLRGKTQQQQPTSAFGFLLRPSPKWRAKSQHIFGRGSKEAPPFGHIIKGTSKKPKSHVGPGSKQETLLKGRIKDCWMASRRPKGAPPPFGGTNFNFELPLDIMCWIQDPPKGPIASYPRIGGHGPQCFFAFGASRPMGRRRSPGAKGAVQVWKPWRFNRTLQPNLLLICLWFKQKLLNLPVFLPEEAWTSQELCRLLCLFLANPLVF